MSRSSWFQTLLLCALLFKAMLPAGIMPDQRDGLPTLVLCSDGHRGWGSSLASDANTDVDAAASESCVYASLNQALSLPSGAVTLNLYDWLAPTAAVISDLPLRAQRSLRPPARAPPLAT